ncbi:MAG: sce7726 family protein [Victivallaceae bacterium]
MTSYSQISNLAILPRLFSNTFFEDLVKINTSSILNEAVKTTRILDFLPNNVDLRGLLDFVYEVMVKRYRNEYVYKNILANKILLGRHSLNTSFMINELGVDGCKADSVIFNGTSTVYEIKTELDSFDRLMRQVGAYIKAFDKVYVVTSDSISQIRQVENMLPPSVGIMVLSKKNRLSIVRETESHQERVESTVIFDILRQAEYLKIIKEYYGYIPQVSNAFMYRASRALFKEIPPKIAHDEMVRHLKKRGKVLEDFILNVPISLKAYSLKTRLSCKQRACCLSLLSTKVHDLLSIT